MKFDLIDSQYAAFSSAEFGIGFFDVFLKLVEMLVLYLVYLKNLVGSEYHT
jgi:hypothetical protein